MIFEPYTYKRAELLTKSWLMGVRRGWLSLLHPTINNWSDVFKAFYRLLEFVDNLEQQVYFVRRGPLTSLEGMPEGQKVQAAFKELRDALNDKRRGAEHWMQVDTEPEVYSRGTFTKADGEKMFGLYKTKFAELLTTYVKARGVPESPYRTQREANLTELLDKILDLLRIDAKRLEEAIKAEEANLGYSPTREEHEEPAFKEFNLGHMKVVVVDPKGSKEYIKWLDKAHQLIHQKGFEKLWYGVLFVSRNFHVLDENAKEAYRKLGYKDLQSRAGAYHSGSDVMEMTAPPTEWLSGAVVHELGHRKWFRFMHSEQRARFNSLIRTNLSESKGSGPMEDGVEKPVSPVSGYGKSNAEEAFAEAFEHYIMGKDMSRDQVESFRSVLASSDLKEESLAQRVMVRFTYGNAYPQ